MINVNKYIEDIHKKLRDPCVSEVFRKVKTDDGIWLIGINEKGIECTDDLWYRANPEVQKYSRGLGGSPKSFMLTSGEKVTLQGPWNGNSQSLYEQTGIDLRHKEPSIVVLTKDDTLSGIQSRELVKSIRTGVKYEPLIDKNDILYADEEVVFGKWHRVLRVAEEYFDSHPEAENICVNDFGWSGSMSACYTRERLQQEILHWRKLGHLI